MKKTTTIFIFLLNTVLVYAQVIFKTIVPPQPVVAGESFQVQYVVENGDETMNVRPPLFNNFRYVAGPNVYMGSVKKLNGVNPLLNSVYTLEALRTGRFIIPGATIMVNGKMIQSNDVLVEVISKEDAINNNTIHDKNVKGINLSEYFLAPGENPSNKISQNLFVRMEIDKKSCFVGEPVLATFKLYSRLESKSDIIKNPGFYGFTVYDIENLADKLVTTERIDGRTFDVHTIRKVQLYPLQPGIFTIDAMQVKNKIAFSHSAINKKAEQKIVEGSSGNSDKETPAEGTEIFETDISTIPVSIKVKPVPDKNQPTGYEGAIGRFSIAASIKKNNLAKNEEGLFEITISGKGNFIQLSAPPVQWPAGIESFESIVKDNFDKATTPLTGSRTFQYPFVCTAMGKYQLPRINFSYFDTDSNTFKTAVTEPVELLVNRENQLDPVIEKHSRSIAEESEKAARTAGVIVLLLVVLILLYWISRKKSTEIVVAEPPEQALPSVEQLLDPAYAVISQEDSRFYSVLHGIIWEFTAQKFNLSGSGMNKQTLADKMKEANLNRSITENLLQILEKCETGIFTNTNLSGDRHSTFLQAKEVMEKINL